MKPSVRDQFPFFQHHPDICYLDNAATTQRHMDVIMAMSKFYEEQNANAFRGVYPLANRASEAIESVRKQVAGFINAHHVHDIGFTQSTTAAINIVANSLRHLRWYNQDNIVVTRMEHHANFIPWQQLAKEKNIQLRIAPINYNRELDIAALENLIDQHTRLVAISHVSNVLGVTNPIETITKIAKAKGALVLIDAAQSAALYQHDMVALPCDFLAFSGHKLFGPFGVGVLYVAPSAQALIKPMIYGGGSVSEVLDHETTWLPYPRLIETGTPDTAGIIGLGKAISWLHSIDRVTFLRHIQVLDQYAREELKKIAAITIHGSQETGNGIISFAIKDIHPHDAATFLGRKNIAVRAGMHCAHPLMRHMALQGSIRISLSMYNEKEEIDRLVMTINELIKVWG